MIDLTALVALVESDPGPYLLDHDDLAGILERLIEAEYALARRTRQNVELHARVLELAAQVKRMKQLGVAL